MENTPTNYQKIKERTRSLQGKIMPKTVCEFIQTLAFLCETSPRVLSSETIPNRNMFDDSYTSLYQLTFLNAALLGQSKTSDEI